MNKIGAELKTFFEEKGLTQEDIANRMGVSQPYISALFTDKKQFGKKQAIKWGMEFGLSPNWLLTGTGNMLINVKRSTEDASTDSTEKDKKTPGLYPTIQKEETRPRIPYEAAAGSLTQALEGITIQHCDQVPVVRGIANYDYSIITRGNSMEGELISGDELFCKTIIHTKFIQWGRIHVLDTAQGILVKRIFEEGEYILCKSELSEIYKDFKVPKKEIYNIGLVVGVLRRY